MSTSGGTPETATIYVTVIIDLTPTRTRAGPSRLLVVVEGRSKQAFKSWLEAQTKAFRDRVEIVAMDGFTGYKTAAVETIDTVTTVMDPYPCGGPGRGQARPLPATRPAGDAGASGAYR